MPPKLNEIMKYPNFLLQGSLSLSFQLCLAFLCFGSLSAQIPNNTCSGAIMVPVQQVSDDTIKTDVIFSFNTIENYTPIGNVGCYHYCVPNGSQCDDISVVDNFFTFIAPSSGSVFIKLDKDLDNDQAATLRESCALVGSAIECVGTYDPGNNILFSNLVPGDSYMLSFMVAVDNNTNLLSKDNKMVIFEVEPFVPDCAKARITEIHYDDFYSPGDTLEYIEITALAGESLAGYTVEIHPLSYGVANPVQYVYVLDGNSTPVPNSENSVDTILLPASYPYIGGLFITSVLPDNTTAISLRDPSGTIVDLISYEGVSVVDGMFSLDIGVQMSGGNAYNSSVGSQDISGHSDWMFSNNGSPNVYNSELALVKETLSASWQGGNGVWNSANWISPSGATNISIFDNTEVSIPSGTVTVDAIFDNNTDCFDPNGAIYKETTVKNLVADGDVIITDMGSLSTQGFMNFNGNLDLNSAITAPTTQVADLFIGDGIIVTAQVNGDLQINNSLNLQIDGLAGPGIAGGHDFLTITGDLEISIPITISVNGTYPLGTEIPLVSYGTFDQILDEQNIPSGWILEKVASSNELVLIKAERPTNDLCSGMIPLVESVDASNITPLNGTNLYGRADLESLCDNNDETKGVWYSINVSEDDVYNIEASNYSYDVFFEIFEGDCNNLQSVFCGGSTTSYSLDGGKNYFLLVTTKNSQTTTFDLALYKYTPPNSALSPVGINTSKPIASLDVKGSVRIGNDSTAVPGTMRFFRNSFEGFDGSEWKDLGASNDNLGSHSATQNLDVNNFKIANLGSPLQANDAATKQYVDAHLDSDSDSYNEIQELILNNNNLSLSNGGNSVTLPAGGTDNWNNLLAVPSGFADGIDNVDDADNDPTNEVETWSTLSGIPSAFSDGIDDVNDSDSDPDNERISGMSLFGSLLEIEEDGTTESIDLEPIATQWSSIPNDQIHYSGGQIGIGLNTGINDRMHIRSATGENALRVQVGTATKLRVYENGAIALGANPSNLGPNTVYVADSLAIGIETPQDKVHVIGGGIFETNSTGSNFQLNLIEDNLGYARLNMTNSSNKDITLAAYSNVNTVDSKLNFFIEDAGDVMTISGAKRVGINTSSPDYPLEVGTNTSNGNGAHVTDGGSWTNGSSRTFKDNFESVKYSDILTKLATVDILLWNYKGSDEGQHLGPIAEEFYEAFGLGNNEQYISTVDADGVALAAIKALNQENETLKKKVFDQEELTKTLIKRLEILEKMIPKK